MTSRISSWPWWRKQATGGGSARWSGSNGSFQPCRILEQEAEPPPSPWENFAAPTAFPDASRRFRRQQSGRRRMRTFWNGPESLWTAPKFPEPPGIFFDGRNLFGTVPKLSGRCQILWNRSETFRAVLSFLDPSKTFQTRPKTFRLDRKSSGRSPNLSDCPKSFRAAQKFSGPSRNFSGRSKLLGPVQKFLEPF